MDTQLGLDRGMDFSPQRFLVIVISFFFFLATGHGKTKICISEALMTELCELLRVGNFPGGGNALSLLS